MSEVPRLNWPQQEMTSQGVSAPQAELSLTGSTGLLHCRRVHPHGVVRRPSYRAIQVALAGGRPEGMTRCRRGDDMNRLVGVVLVLLVVAWFVPAARPLVALGTLVLIMRGAEVDYELSMRSPQ
jgi:hypothetical protein